MSNPFSEVTVENALNKNENDLPLGYFHPETEGKLTWICGRDAEGKITSVFSYDHGTHKDTQSSYLESLEKALEVRDELVRNNWKKVKPPEVRLTYADGDRERPLNRKQKRYLKRKIQQLQKKNPLFRS